MSYPENVLHEAARWLGTPFRHEGDVLGHGVDCAMFAVRVYQDTGMVPAFDPRPYPPNWFLFRDGTLYEDWLRRCMDEVSGDPLPGDLALFRMARANGHAGIVVAWPKVIHVDRDEGVVYASAVTGTLARRFAGAWRPRVV